jgi:hypothetical protein
MKLSAGLALILSCSALASPLTQAPQGPPGFVLGESQPRSNLTCEDRANICTPFLSFCNINEWRNILANFFAPDPVVSARYADYYISF